MTATLSWPRPAVPARRAWRFPAVARDNCADTILLTCPLPARAITSARLLLPAGALCDPVGRYGLADAMAAALLDGRSRQGGTPLAEALEQLGAQLQSRTDWHVTVLALDAPAASFPDAFGIVADALETPDFDERIVARTVGAHADRLAREADDPRTAAGQLLAQNLFPDDSRSAAPLGGRAHEVREFSAETLTAHFLECRGALTLVVAGAADGRQLAERLPAWSGRRQRPVGVVPAPRVRVVVRDQPGAGQSAVCFGRSTPPRTSRDYPGLLLAVTATLDGFTGRVYRRLREERGYTYGVAADVDFGRGSGVLQALFSCPTEVTGAALSDAFELLASARDHGLTRDEVERARRKLVDAATLSLDTTAAVADGVAGLAALGLPPEEYDNARQAITGAALSEADRAAAAYLDPELLTVAVVGDAAAVVPQLEAAGLGPVTLVTR